MKKVISGESLQEKIEESIALLCDTVKLTLGPKGNNVLIDHSLFTPFITNDGATIAKNIESEDEVVNTILEIAKEASLKTNEMVGDGTTTTLVLLQSIFNASLKCIKQGTNPILLKKEMDAYLKEIVEKLESSKMKVGKMQKKAIASIAANDEELGTILSKVYDRVGSKNAIYLEEVDKPLLDVTYLTGYSLETTLASDYFFNEQKEINYQNACILLFHKPLNNIEDIAFILNDCIKNKRNLVIFAEDFEENLVRELVTFYINGELNCCLLKITEYGIRKSQIEKDIEILTDAKGVNETISINNIGTIKNICITNNIVRLDFENNKKLKEYIGVLKEETNNIKDEYDKRFFEKRIAMFENGIATIKIGTPTKTETHEKKMRIEDALCALESAKDGVLLGGGITLLKIAERIKPNSNAKVILKDALEVPFKQILINAGIDYEIIKKEMQNNNFKKIYNVQSEAWEESNSTSVLDSFNVTIESLNNAISIATMLFTTTSLVINEYNNNVGKENEYTEI